VRRAFGFLILGLASCGAQIENNQTNAPSEQNSETGIRPNIVVGDAAPEERAALETWIAESVALFQSPEFEANYRRVSAIYPRVYVSKTQDIIPSTTLLERLKTEDPIRPALWWPRTYVVLDGPPAIRAKDQTGFGFEASRKAAAGPRNARRGEIQLGRLHFARYTRGDVVEKSCAINTMVHEISHTLSERQDEYWMHILDSEDRVTPPAGVFEASYFIGAVAQCTYLETHGRIGAAGFPTCIETFGDPRKGSRFRSLACDDFPGETPIHPNGRFVP